MNSVGQSPTTPRASGRKTARHPFDDISGDVILRTSDKVLFYVHSVIISIASGYFKEQLSRQRPAKASLTAPDSQLIIDVEETSHELYPALSWCYPVAHPKLPGINSVPTILSVAVKYDMASVITHMHLPLRELLHQHSRRVFALACTYNYEDVAQEAAMTIKNRYAHAYSWDDDWNVTTPSQIYPAKMPSIPSALYLRLIQYVWGTEEVPHFCQPSQSSMLDMRSYIIPRTLQFADGDIAIRACQGDRIDFIVHSAIISFSSSVLKHDIIHLTPSQGASPGQRLQVLELPESGTTLSVLLTLCYPSSDSDTLQVDFCVIPDLVEAGRKYAIEAADGFCRRLIRRLEPTDPFFAYSLAMTYGWYEEARHAAVRIARLNTEYQYHPCMETLEAKLYYPLLKFCHEYRKRLRIISEQTIPAVTFDMPDKDLPRCNWMWQLGDCDMRDAAWALAANIRAAKNGQIDQVARLQMIYSKVVEELDQVWISLPVFCR